jgi:hypothetical protein
LVKVGFHVFHAPTIQQQFTLIKRYLCSDHYVSKRLYIYIRTQVTLKRAHTWQLQSV